MELKNQNSKPYKPLPITGISLTNWIRLLGVEIAKLTPSAK